MDPQNAMSFYPKLYSPCQGISIYFYPSVYLLFWNIYLQSIPTSSNICIFLSPHLFLHPVKFISFYQCKKNLDHILSKINPIFKYSIFYFGLSFVYLRYHFLSSFYSINKSNYLQLIIQYVKD